MSRQPDSGSRRRWFGRFEFAMGDCAVWQVGSLQLAVRRGAGEWRVFHRHLEGPQLPAAVVKLGCRPELLDTPDATRYVMEDAGPALRLLPALPDRAVVARPVSPVFIPAGESIRLYVGVPLWIRLEVGEEPRPLVELASSQMSETWIGPNTREGEICYALRSRCRLQLEPGQMQADRTITPLVIRNRSAELMTLERVSLPVRQLSLYAEADGPLWTEELCLERSDSGDLAAVRVDSGAPAEAGEAERVNGPRDAGGRRTAIRAFSALFQ